MYVGAACRFQVRLTVKNSIAIVLVGVLPCTRLAGAVVFCQGSNFAASYKEHRTFLLKIFKVIWYQNLRLIKLDTMVKKLLKSHHKQGSYSHLKKSYYLC